MIWNWELVDKVDKALLLRRVSRKDIVESDATHAGTRRCE